MTIKKRDKRQTKKTQKDKQKNKIEKGGFVGALFGAIDSGERQYKFGQENTSFITQVKQRYFNPRIYNIEYIIPNNILILKDPNSTITPSFRVNFTIDGKHYNDICFIQIAEPRSPSRIKFINYFICVKTPSVNSVTNEIVYVDEWYCMMRIFGINTGVLATWSNVVFYKLDNSWFDINKNSITFPEGTVEHIDRNDKKKLNPIQRFVIATDGAIIRLKSGYTEINSNSGEIYYVLRQFRNTQLLNAAVKEQIMQEATDQILGFD